MADPEILKFPHMKVKYFSHSGYEIRSLSKIILILFVGKGRVPNGFP
jgi:hypothetical protein